MVMRLSLDSACDENSTASIAASQKVSRITALDSFMVLLLVFVRGAMLGRGFGGRQAESFA
jgi:hypothetical protein